MKSFKKFVSMICLCSVMVSSLVLPAMAATNEEEAYTISEIAAACSSDAVYENKISVTTSDDCSVQILIADDLVGNVTYGDIYDIVSENELSEGDVIEITEIGQVENDCYAGSDVVPPILM